MKQQAAIVQNAWTAADPVVARAVALEAAEKVAGMFAGMDELAARLAEPFAELRTETEFAAFLDGWKALIVPFPPVTEKRLQKLFPKAKKLAAPEPAAMQNGALTYRSWVDAATNKWVLVYELQGEAVGIEGRSTPAPKKNICAFCGGFGDVAFVSARTKAKSAASPDYYKSVGQYICASSEACNLRITSVAGLERFVRAVMAE